MKTKFAYFISLVLLLIVFNSCKKAVSAKEPLPLTKRESFVPGYDPTLLRAKTVIMTSGQLNKLFVDSIDKNNLIITGDFFGSGNVISRGIIKYNTLNSTFSSFSNFSFGTNIISYYHSANGDDYFCGEITYNSQYYPLILKRNSPNVQTLTFNLSGTINSFKEYNGVVYFGGRVTENTFFQSYSFMKFTPNFSVSPAPPTSGSFILSSLEVLNNKWYMTSTNSYVLTPNSNSWGVLNNGPGAGGSYLGLKNFNNTLYAYGKIYRTKFEGVVTYDANNSQWLPVGINAPALITDICMYKNVLYAATGNEVYFLSSNGIDWIQKTSVNCISIKDLEIINDKLFVIDDETLYHISS